MHETDLPPSWLAEGSAMRRAIAGDFVSAGARVVMTLDDRLVDEPGPWEVVRIGRDRVSESIVQFAGSVDLNILIAPETGGTLGDLARLVTKGGGKSMGCTPDAIDLATDKLRLSEHLVLAGVPTPPVRAVRPKSGLPRDFAYPAVLKPIDGAGSLDTLLVEHADDCIIASFPHEWGLLQAFVAGEPRSATFLGRPGLPSLIVGAARQQIRFDRGRFSYEGGTILPEVIPTDHPSRLAAESLPGLRGLFGVDFIHDPLTGRAQVLEINPRPTTSCVGLIATLGPGRLASAWLATDPVPPIERHPPLPTPARAVSFRSDGTILSQGSDMAPGGPSR